MGGEAVQLLMSRGDPNLSVAQVLTPSAGSHRAYDSEDRETRK